MMEDRINYNFNQRQCIRSLKRIGFVNRSKRSKHFKFFPPTQIEKRIPAGKPQFIVVPNHNELKVQRPLINELREMGGDELVQMFLENL